RTDLELLTTFFINVRGAQHRKTVDHRWQWNRTGDLSARSFRGADDVFAGLIQQTMIKSLQSDPDSFSRHVFSAYSRISVTVPAPTVLPPSRIAKRSPFSIAIGVINSTSILTLSPGITISTPSGRFTTPVTSVVRK